MDVNLSWDLVIGAAFALMFAYNFMLGQRDTVKLIICNYMGMLAADGIAASLKRYIFDVSSLNWRKKVQPNVAFKVKYPTV